MLLASKNDGPPPRNTITIVRLQNYIDKDQPPSKKEPFRTISEAACAHTFSIVTSADYSEESLNQIAQDGGVLHYAKVHMKLLEIVSGDFYAEYIKTGNIVMISEGRQGHDETFSLQQGVLRLEVLKPTFERLGLEGKPVMGHGRKHTKAQYLIEVNLRLPSMVRGKKGFERLLYAFKNVLTDTKTWLFCNIRSPADLGGPIKAFAPSVRRSSPIFELESDVKVPEFELDKLVSDEDASDLQEWLSLVVLRSPRVRVDDKIDDFLSRYSMPQLLPAPAQADTLSADEDQQNTTMEDATTAEHFQGVRQASWHGLICPDFVKSLYMQLLKLASQTSWLALTVHCFNGESYTIITKDKKVAVYQFKD